MQNYFHFSIEYDPFSVIASISRGRTQSYCHGASRGVTMFCSSAVNWVAKNRLHQPLAFLGTQCTPHLTSLDNESLRGFASVKLLAHYRVL